jgi:hypothetical protein
MDKQGGLPLNFTDSWAKLRILRGYDNQMHVFRHDHVAQEAESTVSADTQNRFDDSRPVGGVG